MRKKVRLKPSKKRIQKTGYKGIANNFLIVLLIAAGLLGGTGIVAFNQIRQKLSAPSLAPELTGTPAGNSQNVILYGAWADNNAVVKAYDTDKKQSYLVATFPQNIKRISFIQPGMAYYINNTDANDYGTDIVTYSLANKTQTASIKAAPGFGIDDYVVSPNGMYIATWEVQKLPGKTGLSGGKSRMYSVDVNNPGNKHLLYDEVATTPIHYPRSISNNGTVLSDMFLPNSGYGWSYGMGVSDFSGTDRQQVASMANGTYGRQPRVSPDGTQLVFAGYDGAEGSGTALVNGMRRAVAQPDTVEVLNAQTLERKKLNLPANVVYDDTRFDTSGRYVFATSIADMSTPNDTKVTLYDLDTNSAKDIPDSSGKRGLQVLPDGKVLMANLNLSDSAMGNLGETYQFVANNFEAVDLKTGQSTPVTTADTNNQFISTSSSLGVDPKILSLTNAEKSGEGSQLRTFRLRINLQQTRVAQQCGGNGGGNGNGGGSGSAPGEGNGAAPGGGSGAAPGGGTGGGTGTTGKTCSPNITVDTSKTPDLANWMTTKGLPAMKQWYAPLGDALAQPDYAPRCNFTVTFDPTYTGLAETSIASGQIRVNPSWPRQHPEDVGFLVHEEMHVMQDYETGNPPTFIVEGIPDYARYYLMKDPVNAPQTPTAKDNYNNGYQAAAYFLNWATTKYGDPQLVHKLNVAAHKGTYTEALWMQMSKGRTVDQSWHDMLTEKGVKGLHTQRALFAQAVSVSPAVSGAPVTSGVPAVSGAPDNGGGSTPGQKEHCSQN